MVSVLSTQASRRTNLHRTANKIKQGSKSSHTLVSTASLYLFLKAELYILTVLTWGRRVPEAADKIAFYRVKVFLFELF